MHELAPLAKKGDNQDVERNTETELNVIKLGFEHCLLIQESKATSSKMLTTRRSTLDHKAQTGKSKMVVTLEKNLFPNYSFDKAANPSFNDSDTQEHPQTATLVDSLQ